MFVTKRTMSERKYKVCKESGKTVIKPRNKLVIGSSPTDIKQETRQDHYRIAKIV
jgi:hypothetical protein